MTTFEEFAQTIKQAADKIVELETRSAFREKEGEVDRLVKDMQEKGLIDEKAAGEKKKELLMNDAADMAVYKKAVELAASRPLQIAAPLNKSAAANPDTQLDSWVYGGY